MEYAETRDPLGFVGARVMRQSRKARRRRQRPPPPASALPAAMKRDPGALPTNADDAMDDTEDEAMVLFGWLTRYDTRLDAYTLFLPNSGGTTLYPRSDVLRIVANAEFQLRMDRDDAFPPPVDDTTSRWVGTPLRKTKKKRSLQTTVGDEDGGGEEVEGRVVCFRPFADRYVVAYDDGASVEMGESEIVDALIAGAKRDYAEREKRKQQHKTPQPNQAEEEADPTVTPVTRKRRRSEELGPSRSEDNNADDEETEDDEPPPSPPRDTGVKGEHMRVREPTGTKREPLATLPTPPERPEPVATQQSSETDPMTPPPSSEPVEPEPDYEFADADDDEPMELLPLDDDDEEEDHDMNSINAGLASIQTGTLTPLPPSSEVIDVLDDDDALTVVAPSSQPSSWSTSTTSTTPPAPRPVYQYYVVRTKPHAATQALDKRSMAFEFLRTELTQLLDAEECASLETSLVADVMTNRDIKDRDAVRRFVETGGLVVINCVLNARAIDALARRHARYDRVLFVLKLLAMLPTPSEQLVMESSIGKTIGRFIKSRMSDAQAAPDAAMPKCIAQLAKWIKHKWIANMDRAKKPGSAAGGPAVAKKHMQRPTQGRPSGQKHSNDPEPIPRRSTASFPSRPPQAPSIASSSSSTDVLGNALATGASSPRHHGQQSPKSSLKPDWMRQKETLTRTRFTINTDANAERQHYQRDRKDAAVAAANTRGPASARGADDAGARGVYGRSQRLSFGPRWNVCEFFKDTPPSAVRRTNASGGSHYKFMARPKSILRKTSKYRGDLTF